MTLIYGSCSDAIANIIKPNSINHIITDPPFAIDYTKNKKTHARKKDKVIDGYIEWTKEAFLSEIKGLFKRIPHIMKGNSNILIFCSWNSLPLLFEAFKEANNWIEFTYNKDATIKYMGQIVWHYNFGVWTSTRPVTSHYNILWFYYGKEGNHVFNPYCRFLPDEKDEEGKSKVYKDLQSVWMIKKEFKPNQERYPTELPKELCNKLVQYFTLEDEVILDPFAGSGRIGEACIKFKRLPISVELNEEVLPYLTQNIYGKKARNMLETYFKNERSFEVEVEPPKIFFHDFKGFKYKSVINSNYLKYPRPEMYYKNAKYY